MNIEQIKELAKRKPFRSFIILLDSGDSVPITSDTELLFPTKRPNTVYVFASDAVGWIFEAQAVSALQQ